MAIFSIISGIFLGLLLIGIVIGVFRSWKKSLVRFCILIGSLLVSILISPLISVHLIGNFVNGSVISAFGFSIDLTETLESLLGESFTADLMTGEAVTEDLVNCLAKIIVNFALTIAIFLVIWLLSLLVYFIVVLVLKSTKKKENVQQEEKSSTKTWWGRLIGGAIGGVSMIVLLFVFCIPVFGAISVCDNFIEESSTEESASAYSMGSYISGQLFYTEDENIGKVETYVEKYSEIRKEYSGSAFGAIMKYTGVEKLGQYSFSYLASASSNDLNINLEDELVVIIRSYNEYKENFVKKGKSLSITDNDSIDAISSLYDTMVKSEIVKSYVSEIIPTATEKWSNGETFLGISIPVSNNMQEIVKDVLSIFNGANIGVINNNIHAFLNTIKVLNNHNLIAVNGEELNIIESLSNDETMVYDLFVCLTQTSELKAVIVDVFNDMFVVIHDEVVGGTLELTNPDAISASVNYNDEAEIMQGIVSDLMAVYNVSTTTNTMEVLANLETVGGIIDSARSSKLFSNSIKQFMLSYLNNADMNLGDNGTTQTTLINYIKNNWDDENFYFSDTFGVVAQTARIAINMSNGEAVSTEDLTSLVSTIISSNNTSDAVSELLNSSAISDYVTGDNAEIMADMVQSFIDNTNSETLANDVGAGVKIIEIISSKNGEDTFDSDSAETLVNSIDSSPAILSLIEASRGGDSGDETNSTLINVVSNSVTASDKELIASAASGTENEDLILALFGITKSTIG